MSLTNFGNFIKEIESANLPIKVTANGSRTIEQTPRNQMRQKGLEALFEDLQELYGDEMDLVLTNEGIVLVGENEPNDVTFSWELKSTIKSVDYDPFLAADNFEQEQARKKEAKELRKAEKTAKENALAEKRKKFMEERASKTTAEENNN